MPHKGIELFTAIGHATLIQNAPDPSTGLFFRIAQLFFERSLSLLIIGGILRNVIKIFPDIACSTAFKRMRQAYRFDCQLFNYLSLVLLTLTIQLRQTRFKVQKLAFLSGLFLHSIESIGYLFVLNKKQFLRLRKPLALSQPAAKLQRRKLAISEIINIPTVSQTCRNHKPRMRRVAKIAIIVNERRREIEIIHRFLLVFLSPNNVGQI